MVNLLNKLPPTRGKYRENADLKNWFDVGGKAEILYKPADINDLQHFLKNIDRQIPLTILGAASNVIIQDGGVEGVVIRLGSEFAKISIEKNQVKAGAAALCGNVARYAANQGLAGLEFLATIPGSIGGAVAMNAGCYDGDISQTLIRAQALDYQGQIHELKNADFGFSYRGNKIAPDFIFVEAVLQARESSVDEVLQKINSFIQKREESQPIRVKTGGSTFKNPIGNKKAWQLIDEAGFRGKKIGDAQFSEKHCNFMINNKKAKAADLIALGNSAKMQIKQNFNIDLEWEIKIIGKN